MAIIIYVVELIGTVAFAISGAMSAIHRRLDFFGVLVLGMITAVGGGAFRDVILGITPPTLFLNAVFVSLAAVVSALTFAVVYVHPVSTETPNPVYIWCMTVFDAVGLGVFCVVGVNTAIGSGYEGNGFLCVFVGTVTGIGGGILRDLLAGQIPMVLRKQVYAVAAILGAWVYYLLLSAQLDQTIAMMIGASLVVLIRLLAAYYRWSLPKVPIS